MTEDLRCLKRVMEHDMEERSKKMQTIIDDLTSISQIKDKVVTDFSLTDGDIPRVHLTEFEDKDGVYYELTLLHFINGETLPEPLDVDLSKLTSDEEEECEIEDEEVDVTDVVDDEVDTDSDDIPEECENNDEEDFKHVFQVHRDLMKEMMDTCAKVLKSRSKVHDKSKLEEPEYSMFADNTNMPEYGTKEYFETIENMKKDALNHHYEVNTHHPEHYKCGISGMNLFDIMEMLCDWYTSSMQHGTSFDESILVSMRRFRIVNTELESIIKNTIPYFYKFGIRIIYACGEDDIIYSNEYNEMIEKIKELPSHIAVEVMKIFLEEFYDGTGTTSKIYIIKNAYDGMKDAEIQLTIN